LFLDNETELRDGDITIGSSPGNRFPFAFKTCKCGSSSKHDGNVPCIELAAMKPVNICSSPNPAQIYLRQYDPLLNEDKSSLTKFVALHIFDGNIPLKQLEPANNTRSDGNENTDSDMDPVKSLLDTSKKARRRCTSGFMKLNGSASVLELCRSFPCIAKISNLLKAEKVSGMVPVSVLSEKSSCVRFTICPKSEGMPPVNELANKKRNLRSMRLLSSRIIVPVSELVDRSRYTSFVRFANSRGIVPVSKLVFKSSSTRFARFANSRDIVPMSESGFPVQGVSCR